MQILTPPQHQVLAFVGACNLNFYEPTESQAQLWMDHPQPREATYRTIRRDNPLTSFPTATATSRMLSAMLSESLQPLHAALGSLAKQNLELVSSWSGAVHATTQRELVTPAESIIQHLIRLAWLEEASQVGGALRGLRLTDLGRALLRHVETEDEHEADVSVVVLGRDDPLAYPTLIGQLATAGPGMLVDPYLKLPDLHTIMVSTQLNRLLVSGKSNNRGVVGSMQAYLASPSLGRRVEVRSTNQLHDRLLLPEDGDVLTVGTSLNGVGSTTTVMTPIPLPARDSLRAEYEQIWSEADFVGPPPSEEEEEDDGHRDDTQPLDVAGEVDDTTSRSGRRPEDSNEPGAGRRWPDRA